MWRKSKAWRLRGFSALTFSLPSGINKRAVEETATAAVLTPRLTNAAHRVLIIFIIANTTMQLLSAPEPNVAQPQPPMPTFRIHDPSSARKKKVLILEDDPAFKEIITDFLTENGFEVRAVMNGVEGVHEVLASDFEVILCDMLMPTLPGDMFFRAVERMRPYLCSRFIFMTGYRGNTKVNDFIQMVNGTVITKPFPVDDLLELFAFVQLRTTLMAAA